MTRLYSPAHNIISGLDSTEMVIVVPRWDFTSLSLPEVKAKFDASTPLVTVTEATHIIVSFHSL